MRYSVAFLTSVRSLLVASALTLAVAHSGRAQNPATVDRSEPAVCWGFAFGKWTPPLDWQFAGHGSQLDSARVPRAPGGRGWAAGDVEAQTDTSLLLFPPWWPAGVLVRFDAKPKSPSDTVAGRATAFVADGRKEPSTSPIRGWLVPCQS